MTRTGGSARDGTWQVTLDTGANDITKAGKLAFYAVATDGAGKDRRIPSRGSDTITVAVCENKGPAITSISSSAGSSLYWQALRTAVCEGPTATNITAAVKDVDGVKSVTLFYKRPGDASYQKKPMDNTTVKGKWYANLDTLGDNITITDPPTDNLRWYIKSVDDKGKASQSATKTITIRRCDSAAGFKLQGVGCGGTSVQVGTYAVDPDNPNGGLKVVFHLTYISATGAGGTVTRKVAATTTQGDYYYGYFDVDTSKYGVVTGSYYVTTTDRYGGTSRSETQTMRWYCQ